MTEEEFRTHATNAYPRLVAALYAACYRISTECCSHAGPCEWDKETCYISEYLTLLRELGE
jgi:hypothetical protein